MKNNYVFTLRSLQAYLEHVGPDDFLEDVAIPNDASWGIRAASSNGSVFVVHRDDTVTTPRAILLAQSSRLVQSRTALQRIHRVAIGAASRSVRLPSSWAEYHHNNLVAFFAWPKS